MKLVKKFLACLLIVVFCLNTACIEDPVSLADLFLSGFQQDLPIAYVVGITLRTVWEIMNGKDDNADDTETAQSNTLNVQAYELLNNNDWQFCAEKDYPLGSLKAGERTNIEVPVQFNKEGTYVLVYNIDPNNVVKERNEDNNDGDINSAVDLHGLKKQFVIQINQSDALAKVDPGEPVIFK